MSEAEFDKTFAPMWDIYARSYSCFGRQPSGHGDLIEAPTRAELMARIQREGLIPCRVGGGHD